MSPIGLSFSVKLHQLTQLQTVPRLRDISHLKMDIADGVFRTVSVHLQTTLVPARRVRKMISVVIVKALPRQSPKLLFNLPPQFQDQLVSPFLYERRPYPILTDPIAPWTRLCLSA